MKRHYLFNVNCAGFTSQVRATSRGNAYRKAFRVMIERGRIKNQPPSDPSTGGFVGVTCECRCEL